MSPSSRLNRIRDSLRVAYAVVCLVVFSAIVVGGLAVYIHAATTRVP